VGLGTSKDCAPQRVKEIPIRRESIEERERGRGTATESLLDFTLTY